MEIYSYAPTRCYFSGD